VERFFIMTFSAYKRKPLSQCYALPAPLSGAPHLPNFIILYNFNQYIFEN
jgi:hypothetical protein